MLIAREELLYLICETKEGRGELTIILESVVEILFGHKHRLESVRGYELCFHFLQGFFKLKLCRGSESLFKFLLELDSDKFPWISEQKVEFPCQLGAGLSEREFFWRIFFIPEREEAGDRIENRLSSTSFRRSSVANICKTLYLSCWRVRLKAQIVEHFEWSNNSRRTQTRVSARRQSCHGLKLQSENSRIEF